MHDLFVIPQQTQSIIATIENDELVIVGPIDLSDNGTYEHIEKGDGNEKWLGIKSSTVGSSGSAQHLTIHGNHKVKMEYSTNIYKTEASTNAAIFVSNQYDDAQDDFIREYIDDYFSKSKAEREILLNG